MDEQASRLQRKTDRQVMAGLSLRFPAMGILPLAKWFRILKGWKIRVSWPTRLYCDRVCFKPKERRATVYLPHGERPVDFYLHELLHVCLIELGRMDRRKPKELRAAEESLVRDICTLFMGLMKEADGTILLRGGWTRPLGKAKDRVRIRIRRRK